MNIKIVTATGADDSIQPMQLVNLTQKYPYVEWAILVSASQEGRNRFPSIAWLDALAEVQKTFNLPLSAHICGRWVRELLFGGLGFFEERKDYLWMFNRFQINTHAESIVGNSGLFYQTLQEIAKMGKQVIFQQDGVNDHLLNIGLHSGLNSVPLFDMSHGAGVLPDKWPAPIGDYCGYAGGLSPENVFEQCGKMGQMLYESGAGDAVVWIDAETRLRSLDDSIFDLDKVEKYLEAAKPFVG